MACDADAVVIGFVNSKSSNIIESGTFLFTDYEVTVKEALKNNAADSFGQESQITVTRGGGAVELNGHIVRAIDPDFGQLQVGKHYLFYLKYISQSGGYRPLFGTSSEDTFLLDGEQVSQVSRKALPFGQHAKADANPFLAQARQAAAHSSRRGM